MAYSRKLPPQMIRATWWRRIPYFIRKKIIAVINVKREPEKKFISHYHFYLNNCLCVYMSPSSHLLTYLYTFYLAHNEMVN